MSKVVFFNTPAQGHINPPRELVRELVARGEDVTYFVTEEYKDMVTETGATFMPYPQPFDFNRDLMTGARITMGNHFLAVTAQLMQGPLVEQVRALQPDYVIHDHLAGWGVGVAHALRIPRVCSNTTMAFSRKFIWDYVRVNRGGAFSDWSFARVWEFCGWMYMLRFRLGVKGPLSYYSIYSNFGELNLVYTSRDLQPHRECFDERFLFVGPLLGSRVEDNDTGLSFQREPGKPLIYISLGTLFGDSPDFYRKCYEALGDAPYQVILAVTNRSAFEALPEAPANFYVAPYVPQIPILKRADVFITHGGGNSVNEGLIFNVPLLVAAQYGEQFVLGYHVQKQGAGLALLDHNYPSARIREYVDRLLTEEPFRAQARRLGESLRNAGGLKRAVDAIFALKRKHGIT